MLRHRSAYFVGMCLLAFAGCRGSQEQSGRAQPPQIDTARLVRQLADAYLGGYFERNPDAVTVYGGPGRHHDNLPDNSLDALKAWQAREDAWLAQARQLNPDTIGSSQARATYAI